MNRPRVRRWLAPVAIVVVAAALLALPPVRAAADQLLQVFRVQTVVFVPVSGERMQPDAASAPTRPAAPAGEGEEGEGGVEAALVTFSDAAMSSAPFSGSFEFTRIVVA